MALCAGFFHLALGILSVLLLLGEVDDRRVGTLHGKEQGRGRTNATVAAGDEGLFALELPGGLVLRCLSASLRELVAGCIWAGHLMFLPRKLLTGDRDVLFCIVV